jgi:hypothetical protein
MTSIKPQDIDSILQQSDKTELISLIKRMLDRHPDLEYLLLTASKQGPSIDPQIHRKRVETVFRASGDDWDAVSEIASELLEIKETGDTFAQRHDYASANVIYNVILSGVIEHHDEYSDLDEEGALNDVVAECLDGLRQCLNAMKDNKVVREQIFRTLFAIYLIDIEAGGIGLGDDVPDILVQDATADERQMITEWVYEAIAEDKQKAQRISYASHWYNGFAFEEEVISGDNFSLQCLGNFLLDLHEDTLDDTAYLRICLETGRVADAIQRLLELGRVDEAVQATKQADDYALSRIADLFVQSGQEAVAERFMQQRVWKSRNVRVLEWLSKHSKPDRDHEDALRQATAQFQEQPGLEAYKAARQLSTESGYWEKTRSELLAFLKNQRLNELLVQVALDEDDTDEIVKIIQTAGWTSSSSNKIIPLIEAAEETQPEVALQFYQRYAAYLIGNRNRAAYEQATRILMRIRALYQKLGKHENWTRYIKKLHEQSKSLKAFRNMLSASGLL